MLFITHVTQNSFKMKNSILLFCVLLVLNATAQEMVTTKSNNIGESVNEYVSRCEPFGFSGALLVAKNGNIILNKGYGFSDKEKGIKNTKNSIFSTGSVTKQFTAAAILKLEMMGKINTTDKLGKYFEVPSDKKAITLHNLLTHTSGLPLAFSNDDFERLGKEEYLDKTFNSGLAFTPGERFKYSNVGYVLLALIVEKQSGMSYEEFLHKHLFIPSGMEQTGYAIPKWNEKNFVHIYNGEKDNGTTERFTKPTLHLLGNGGILSTTRDMYLWIEALKNNTVLSKEATKKLFTPFKNQYAYGWDAIDQGNLRQHNGGSNLGCGAELRWFVNEDLVTMVFSNTTIGGDQGFDVIRNELEALTMGDDVPMPPKITKVDKDLASFIGKYQFPSGEQFKITGSKASANLIVDNQELLDFILEPEAYRPGGINVSLNQKFEKAFDRALNEGDFSGFDFTGNVEELKFEINNEIKLEGIKTPHYKVVRTVPSPFRKDTKVAIVAINDSPNFEGPSLMLHIETENEKYAGIGVNFGFVSPINLSLIPTGEDTFQAYSLASKTGAKLKLTDMGDDEFVLSNQGQSIKIHRID